MSVLKNKITELSMDIPVSLILNKQKVNCYCSHTHGKMRHFKCKLYYIFVLNWKYAN